MVAIYLASAIILLIAIRGVWRLRQTLHNLLDGEPKSLQVFRSVTRTALLLSSSFVLTCLFIPIGDGTTMLMAVSAALLSCISLVAGNSLHELAITQKSSYKTSRSLIKLKLKTLFNKCASIFRLLIKSLSPEKGSFKELHFSHDFIDRILSIESFVKVFLWIAASTIPLLLLGIYIFLNNLKGIPGALSRAMVGYNSLFVISIFTLATLGMIILVQAAQYLGVTHLKVSIKKALAELATMVGYGTLTGVVGAALLPLTIGFLNQTANQNSNALLPSVLVDLPATGAILGYLFGIIRIILNFGSQSTNHFYRYFLMPSIFSIQLYVYYRIGLNFELLYNYSVDNEIALKEFPIEACSSDEGLIIIQEKSSDPSWILAVAEHCGMPILINSGGFFAATSCIVLGLALIKFTNYLVHRFKNLIKSESNL